MSRKYCACHTKRLVTRLETCCNVTKCHAKWSYATLETSKSDLFCRTYHRHGHTALTRTVANGCERLRTVANGCGRLGNVWRTQLNPQTPRVKREHSGKTNLLDTSWTQHLSTLEVVCAQLGRSFHWNRSTLTTQSSKVLHEISIHVQTSPWHSSHYITITSPYLSYLIPFPSTACSWWTARACSKACSASRVFAASLVGGWSVGEGLPLYGASLIWRHEYPQNGWFIMENPMKMVDD